MISAEAIRRGYNHGRYTVGGPTTPGWAVPDSTAGEHSLQTDPVVDTVLFLAMLISATVFYLWFWCKSGQTLGMLAWRLRVQDYQGHLLTPGRALMRLALAWPSFLLFGFGYLWLVVDSNHDAAHDRLSKTRVVLLPKEFQLIQ